MTTGPISSTQIFDKLKLAPTNQHRVCYIFGAGASKGYSRSSNATCPPVVDEFFDDDNAIVKSVIHQPQHDTILRRRGAIREELREHGNDLEAYLGSLFNLHPANELFANLLLYLQDIFFLSSQNIDLESENNNYLRLIYRMESLRGTNWSCITFNYDTILEKTFVAAGSDGRTFSQETDYAVAPQVIKVHGGTNCRFLILNQPLPHLRKRDLFQSMMAKSQNEEVRTAFRLLSLSNNIPPFSSDVYRTIINGQAKDAVDYNFPAMMIPIHNAHDEYNEFFKNKLRSAIKEIEKSDLVIAVGYNFGDIEFVKALKTLNLEKKELVLIGAEDHSGNPEQCLAWKRLREVWVGQIWIFAGEKFSGFVDAIVPR